MPNAVAILLSLDGSMLAQKLCYFGLFRFERDRKRCVPSIISCVHIGTAFEEKFREIDLTAAGSFVQRTSSFFTSRADISAAVE